MALAYLGRREEAQPLIERGIAGGWTWASVIDYLGDLGMRPAKLPMDGVDFSPPSELMALLPADAEAPLPWEPSGPPVGKAP